MVPRVDALWTRAVQNADGVYHGVSLIKNPLPNARGDSISYVMSLYDAQNILVAERRGTLSLDPGESRVVFEPNIIVGERTPVRALLKVDGGTFTRADPTARPVKVVVGAVDEKAQTLTATLENTTAAPITNVVADALLFDREGEVVTASETALPVLPAHTRREVVFTWSKAFLRPITTSDVIVRIDAGL